MSASLANLNYLPAKRSQRISSMFVCVCEWTNNSIQAQHQTNGFVSWNRLQNSWPHDSFPYITTTTTIDNSTRPETILQASPVVWCCLVIFMVKWLWVWFLGCVCVFVWLVSTKSLNTQDVACLQSQNNNNNRRATTTTLRVHLAMQSLVSNSSCLEVRWFIYS